VAGTRRPLPPPEVETRLRAQFGDDIVSFEDQFGHSVVAVAPDRYRDLATFLRDEPEFACDYCDFVGCVDFGTDGIEVVTHLFSTTHDHNVRLKVRPTGDPPTCASIADLFATANWHEREAAEMFGVAFSGHPLPVKLLLPEPFEGHPLRKDFALMSREAKPWPGSTELDGGDEEE
jgi:NADH-quinone oxidoreductase subunit C